MSYDNALDLMRNGYQMRRDEWDLTAWVRIVDGELRFFAADDDNERGEPWEPSDRDRASSDWEFA